MSDQALTVQNNSIVVRDQWSANDVIHQVRLIQEVMSGAMQKDQHYGVIPGCGDKPTLLKAGAEKLGLTFRLAPSFEITKTTLPKEHREYEVTCTLTHIPSGQVWGQGVGSCSTMESKYRFRSASYKCPECGNEAIIKGKAEYGGGFVCFKKKGGCGAKFKDNDTTITNQAVGKVENDNPADQYNTVLKMAKKRAQIDAMLTATAASDIFTQDIEDLKDIHVEIVDYEEMPPSGNGKNGKKTETVKTLTPKEQFLLKCADAQKWLFRQTGTDNIYLTAIGNIGVTQASEIETEKHEFFLKVLKDEMAEVKAAKDKLKESEEK